MPVSVQDNLSNSVLNQFHISIGTNITEKTQDWPTRQRIAYEAIKGLMVNDWHGLQDFRDQLNSYSNTHIILRTAFSVIQSIIPFNSRIRDTLVQIPGMGLVGNFLLSLPGFNSIFVAPQDLLSNSNQLNSTISSLS